jgi:hypothetical protein
MLRLGPCPPDHSTFSGVTAALVEILRASSSDVLRMTILLPVQVDAIAGVKDERDLARCSRSVRSNSVVII